MSKQYECRCGTLMADVKGRCLRCGEALTEPRDDRIRIVLGGSRTQSVGSDSLVNGKGTGT